MKIIHLEICIYENGHRQDVLPAIVDRVSDGMVDVKVAHFILARAAESLPPPSQAEICSPRGIGDKGLFDRGTAESRKEKGAWHPQFPLSVFGFTPWKMPSIHGSSFYDINAKEI